MLRLTFFALFLIHLINADTSSKSSIGDTFKCSKKCEYIYQVIDKKGWIIYWHDQIIWVADSSQKDLSYSDFFKTSFYEDGIVLNGHYKAESLRNYAKKYAIYYPYLKSGNKKDLLWLLPVNVKVEHTGSEPNNLDYLSFDINGKTIQLSYRFRNNYRITEISLIKSAHTDKSKKDKSKIRKE